MYLYTWLYIFYIYTFGHTKYNQSSVREKKSPLKYIIPSVEHKNINNQINVWLANKNAKSRKILVIK